MLNMESITKEYTRRGQTITALSNASFKASEGDFVAIVGASGSGKSTILLTLGGMLSPSEGKVEIQGQSLYDLTLNQRACLRREKIGFVFQTFNLVPYLSALNNVQLPLFLAKIDEKRQREKAEELLDRMGLADRLDHKPGELSVGQQQRVALARMLANDPKIILADEPTGSLDPETGRQIMDIFKELNGEGRTIVMVTHNPDEAKNAKRTVKLVAGQIHTEIDKD